MVMLIVTRRTPDGQPDDIQTVVALDEGMKIGDLLKKAKLPQPIDFAKVMIIHERAHGPANHREYTSSAIGWDAKAGEPSADDNLELKNGDIVKLQGPTPPTATLAPQGAAKPARPIEYKLALIEDREDELAEFGVDDEPAVFDAAALRPVFRILEKHELVSRISSPQLMTTVDCPAQFNLAVPAEGQDRVFKAAQQIKITCVRDDAPPNGDALVLELEAMVAKDGATFKFDGGVKLREGQTALVRLRDGDKAGPVYVAITPEWVD
jgi:hypothetical protein